MLVRGMLNIQQKVQPTKISIKKNQDSNVEIRLIICYNTCVTAKMSMERSIMVYF